MKKECWTRPSSIDRVDDLLPEHLHLEWSVLKWTEAIVLHHERTGAKIPLWNSEEPPDEPTIEHLVTQLEELAEELGESTDLIRNATGLS